MDRSDLETTASTRPPLPIRAHLVGRRDEAMVGLARWLTDEGIEVSSGLSNSRVDQAHRPASVPRSARWLVYSHDVPREHHDRLTALRDGVVERSYSEVLAEVMASRQGIAVAGKRQGRVAAAMIGWTLAQAGLDPTVVLRGTASQFGGPGLAGQGSHAVVDVTAALDAAILCETPPAIALMLDLQSLNESESKILLELVSRVSESGYLVAGADHAIFGMEPFAANPAVESLSLERGSAWWGADLREERGRFRFRAFHKGNFASEIKLQVPGRSSVISALAALAVCSRIEVPTLTIKEALEDFEGVSRGFESRGSYRGVTLLDDDSAGAIEVAEALALVRSVHGRRRLWTVFAPGGRACSATSAALSATDHLILVDGGIDSGDWECMLEEAGVHAHRVENLDEAVLDLDRHLEPGDVLLTLGAGEVGTIADAFIRRLSRDRQGR